MLIAKKELGHRIKFGVEDVVKLQCTSINVKKLILRSEADMKKCKSCQWSSDKCKNPNSKNKDKFIVDIVRCKPLLIKN